MRISPVLFILGKVLLVLGCAMLLPLAVALSYNQGDALPFVHSIVPTWLCATLLLFFCRKSAHTPLRQREGYLFVTLVWLAAAIFGALPFNFGLTLSANFTDALFESMSGFSTTGVTSFTDIESLPKGLLFWRALTPWLGGAGIVMLFIAVLRGKDGSGAGAQIFNAELQSGGELADKITPRIGDGVKAMFVIFVGLTLAEILLLLLGGMDLYDATVHAFGTLSTGGFSSHNAGIAYYNSAYIEWVIIAFMFIASINLGLYYQLLMRNKSKIFRDEETRVFVLICVLATVLITAVLYMQHVYLGRGFGYTIRQAAFQTISVITTTGFSTENYNIWPVFPRGLIFLLIFVGGCIGSTASSIKVSRVIVGVKACRNELLEMVHPRLVKKLYFNKKPISQNTVRHLLFFVITFCFFTLAGALLLTLSGLTLTEALTTSLSCISNVGSGLGGLSHPVDYATLNGLAKYVLIFNMLIGRLEIFTVLVLFLPGVWKK